MKQLKNLLCCGFAVVLAGCVAPDQRTTEGGDTSPATVAGSRSTVISLINPQYRFVVVDFAGHSMPVAGTRLAVYRANKRIGVVRLTEPMRSGLATADILEGELRVGDEVR